MVNNSLKEYYIKLNNLYNNAINMLTAINQSLSTNSPEVTVSIIDNDNVSSNIRIPSFLHLDNKIEQLESTINNLFSMPKSGEAWFSNTGDMYKLKMVRTNTAPLIPELEINNINASFNTNTFIKDLVSPRTFLKINVDNLPDNIENMYMKKIVLLNTSLYNDLLSLDLSSYEEYKAALYNYHAGVDYEEYDDVLNLPIKQDKYKSSFVIDYILSDAQYANNSSKLTYQIQLDTLEYTNNEDSSIIYKLKIGDYLCLGNELVIYKVIDVDYSINSIIIEETIGHIALQSFSDNSEMILTKYNYNYSEYNYVEVPIEENQFIILFLGNIYNGVRSQLSKGILFDLSNIYMINSDGSYIKDNYGNNIDYVTYYNKYCSNIGDLILGLTETAYPQLSNYTSYQLKELQDSQDMIPFINNTFNESILSVVPINTHIYDDTSIENIKNYHAQKCSLQSDLNTLTENINTTNSLLINTDWSQETDITQESLQSQVQKYYSERLTLEKQINAVINNINTLKTDNNVTEETKYRIRGVTEINTLEEYIKSITNNNVNIIGLDVEYKYKSISRNTTFVSNIGNNVFTEWNKLYNIDRQRKLIFDDSNNTFNIEFVNYDTTANIVKWNQIDIPINSSEDVVIRVRYKYNIGQPFINLYTPWSDEITVSFPTEYADDIELAAIINSNDNDVVNSKFTSKLINDGYEEHITNNIISGNQNFYHDANNIYSGFTTAENSLISLKSKLDSMCEDIREYKELVNTESQKKFNVYLQYDSKTIELNSNITNKINIYNNEHISDYFIRKEMNIVIKNTGSVPLNLYSIFPGNIDVPLVTCNYEYYKNDIENYYRMPIFVNNILSSQYLGQWIYFRENNVYTGKSVLYNNQSQLKQDYINKNSNKVLNIIVNNDNPLYIKLNDNQLGLANRYNKSKIEFTNTDYLGFINNDGIHTYDINTVEDNYELSNFIYTEDINSENSCLYMYENIHGLLSTDNSQIIYLDNNTTISSFKKLVSYNKNILSSFDGGFLFVNLENLGTILTDGSEKGNIEIAVGSTISIPVVFEYYLTDIKSISKTLMFDIRPSLIKDPKHYILELTANYDTSLEANIYKTSDLEGI